MSADREAIVANEMNFSALMMLMTAGRKVSEDAFFTAVTFLAAPENREFAQKWLKLYSDSDLSDAQLARLTQQEWPLRPDPS